MTLYATDFDLPSRYLKASDFEPVGTEKRLKISGVVRELVGEKQEPKAVLQFTTVDRGLILNTTNRRALQAALGNDMSLWIGKIVIVFSTMASFRGQMVPSLRVRIPPPKNGGALPPPRVDLDDEIDTFGAPVTDIPEVGEDELPEVR